MSFMPDTKNAIRIFLNLKCVKFSLTIFTFAYVTYRDIRDIRNFKEQTVIAVKAPPETRLEVPDPNESIQIWLKSIRGAIEVFLCPDDKENDPCKPLKNLSPIKAVASVVPSGSSNDFPAPQIKPSLSPEASPEKLSMLLHTHDTVPNDLEDDLAPLSPSLTDEEYMFSLSNTEVMKGLDSNTSNMLRFGYIELN
ncbi:Transcription factor E2F3 [Exaiptasia diaphana]|nr:Transcription factor E2F3 [Exaiptasia diaphana]